MSVLPTIEGLSSSTINWSFSDPESSTASTASKADSLIQSLLEEALSLAEQSDQQFFEKNHCHSYSGIALNQYQGLGRDIRKKVAIQVCTEDFDRAVTLLSDWKKHPNEYRDSCIEFINETLRKGLRQEKPINIDKIIALIDEKDHGLFLGEVTLLRYITEALDWSPDSQPDFDTVIKYLQAITTHPVLIQKTLEDLLRETTPRVEDLPKYLIYCSDDFIFYLITRFEEEGNTNALLSIFEYVLSIPLKMKIVDEFSEKKFYSREELPYLFHEIKHYYGSSFEVVDRYVFACLEKFSLAVFNVFSDRFQRLFDLQGIHENTLRIYRERDPKATAYFEENLKTTILWATPKDPNNVHVTEIRKRMIAALPTILWGDPLKAFIATFAKDNPEIAIDLTNALEKDLTERLKDLLSSIHLTKQAINDPDKGLEYAQSLISEDRPNAHPAQTLLTICRRITSQDPVRGVQVLKQLEQRFSREKCFQLHNRIFETITQEVAEVNPTLALKLIEPIRKYPKGLLPFIPHFAKSDPKLAFTLLHETLPNGSEKDSSEEREALASVAIGLAPIDFPQALRLIEQLKKDSDFHKEILKKAIERALEINPAAILAYERGIKNADERDRFLRKVLREGNLKLLVDQHNSAIELISDIQNPKLRKAKLRVFALTIGAKNPQRAYEIFRMTANKEGKYPEFDGESFAEVISEEAPELALEILERCKRKHFVSHSATSLCERIGERLAPDDIGDAPKLIKKYRNYVLRYLFFTSMLIKLAKVHGKAAISVLELVDDNHPWAKGVIIEKMTKYVARKDLDAAHRLADRIEDVDCRERALLRVAKIRALTDFFSAEIMVRDFSSLYLKSKGLVVLSKQLRLIMR